MQRVLRSIALAFALGTSLLTTSAALDATGVAALRQCDSRLDGRGVRVAQVEASAPGWQANPNVIGQCGQAFAWICAGGVATNFPNPIGTESGHADEVARQLFGIAPNIASIENYEATFFAGSIIPSEEPISAKIVNQSFAYFTRSLSVDQDYDDYAARFNVLFVSGSGNTGRPKSPGTAFNGICVGASGGPSSVGPISDGRCKPDITAPAAYSSFAAPLVSATAAILLQAAGSEEARDIRSLKALLLNGANKPPEWTNSRSAPLDARYGAGIVNAFNSYRQLRGGKVSDRGNITSRRGWDHGVLCSMTNEYVFRLSASNPCSFTATLTWLRNYGQTNVSNLDLLLFGPDGSLAASSQSPVDNVEHIFIPTVSAGIYRLEVLYTGQEAANETYALAFEFRSLEGPRFLPPLAYNGFSEGVLIGEPNQLYLLQASTNLSDWNPVATNTTSSDGKLMYRVPANAGSCFFRALALP